MKILITVFSILLFSTSLWARKDDVADPNNIGNNGNPDGFAVLKSSCDLNECITGTEQFLPMPEVQFEGQSPFRTSELRMDSNQKDEDGNSRESNQ